MDHKVIVITGSTNGIGFAMAKEFLKRGHKLIINGRNPGNLQKRLEELKVTHGEVYGYSGDVAEEATHEKLIDLAMEKYGRVDLYINNAGIPQHNRAFVDLDSQSIRDLVNINISGLMLGTKIAASFMLKQGFGKIFNMEGFGSDGRTMNKLTLYGTSKRAVNYFTKSVAKELKETCVQIGSMNPGMVDTDFLRISMEKSSPKESKQFEKVKRIMAEDVNKVAPFLVNRILQSNRNYDRIRFLTGPKLFVKIVKLIFT